MSFEFGEIQKDKALIHVKNAPGNSVAVDNYRDTREKFTDFNGNDKYDADLSLKIDGGVVIKFAGNYSMTVNGRLNLLSTSNNKIIFTSIQDDDAGTPKVDSGNDGYTTGSPGQWGSLYIQNGDNEIHDCEFRYAKHAIQVRANGKSVNPTIKNNLIENCSQNGIYIRAPVSYDQGLAANPVIQGNIIQKVGEHGI